MPSVFPGRPEAKLQAVSVGQWEGRHLIAYISGTSLVLLDGPESILQTILIDEASSSIQAVCIQQDSGKIAVAAGPTVYIFQPNLTSLRSTTWSLQYQCDIKDTSDRIETLSWGRNNELLAGGNSLTLFNLFANIRIVWTIPLANRAKFAQFSPDGQLIVTTGIYDKLLKVWRRLGSGPHDQQFEFSYLPHNGLITSIHWRQPLKQDLSYRNVLYTLCTDNKLRIWTNLGTNGSPTFLKKWDELDLQVCIQPRADIPAGRANRRYAMVVDGKDFMLAAERAVAQAGTTDEEHQTIAHLAEVVKYTPEVCIIFDGNGGMSAWGFSNIEAGSRAPLDIFNIAHIQGLDLTLEDSTPHLGNNVRFYNFCDLRPNGAFNLLVHQFSGRIEWYECRIDRILTSAILKERQLHLRAVWTGHSSAVKKVVRTGSGRAAISRTEDNDAIMWTVSGEGLLGDVVDRSRIKIGQHVHRIWVLREGDFVVFLHHESISLWDCRKRAGRLVATRPYSLQGKPLSLLLIPEATGESKAVHIATISSEMKGISWEIRLPPPNSSSDEAEGLGIFEFESFDLGGGSDLAYILPVDPAGCVPEVPGVFDSSARDVAFSYTYSGLVKTWSARVNLEKGKIEWFNTATLETFIEKPSLASGTSIRKVSLIDSSKRQLTIWSTRSSQLEYSETFPPHDQINDVDWSWTPDGQSILSVGFRHKILLYTQLRYDYLDKGSAWAAIKEINIFDTSPHPIGDSVWLTGGRLLVGVGNQLIVDDHLVDGTRVDLVGLRLAEKESDKVDIYTLVRRLNGPLPVFHPQFLSQCVLVGKFALVHKILLRLFKVLETSGRQSLPDLFTLDIPNSEIWAPSVEAPQLGAKRAPKRTYDSTTDDSIEEPTIVDENVGAQINELIQTVQVGPLSSHEQLHLADIVSCMGTVGTHSQSLDAHACRYLLFFRQHILSLAKTRAASAATVPTSWREITWAFHSESQGILIDLIGRHYNDKMTWKNARQSGMFMWIRDMPTLRAEIEKVARNEYTKDGDRNPINCSLYYLALKKKQVLVGLWRIAVGHKERDITFKFLSNNFTEARWKSAATKNAYALMGKHRFEYAAAFFLLAGQVSDAVNILITKLDDLQLAITVARVWEDGVGPVTKKVLVEHALPRAARDGNRWLASWAFWMLKQRDMALRAIIEPLSNLVPLDHSPESESKIFLADDPALAVLYRDLRERSLQALSGSLAVEGSGESAFVLQTANIYIRMGCHWLALDLVRNWQYLNLFNIEEYRRWNPKLGSVAHSGEDGTPADGGGQARSPSAITIQTPEVPAVQALSPASVMVSPSQARRILRRRSSLVVNDLPEELLNYRDFGAPALRGRGTSSLDRSSTGLGNGTGRFFRDGDNDGEVLSDDDGANESEVGKKQKEKEREKGAKKGDRRDHEGPDEDDGRDGEEEEVPPEGGEDGRATDAETGPAQGAKISLRPDPPPTVFQEPDPNSILDAFDF